MKGRRALAALVAAAQLTAAAPPPPVSSNYQPTERDERGLWMQSDELERQLKASSFLIRDPALNTYVRDVFCRTVTQERCQSVRIYILRTPYFNAAMAPNGVMLVFSGLFLRVKNEAQLAAVLGHEYTHYANRHSLRNFRDLKAKADAAAWLSFVPIGGLAATAALSIAQLGLLGSVLSFSREMEREADAGSVPLMAGAGYDPAEAAHVWEQIRAEADATAVARGTRSRKDKNGGMFATHPGSAERVAELQALARQTNLAAPPDNRRGAYMQALAPHWSDFVDDQIKLNDFGGTELLLAQLAAEGWTPDLLFARGELYRTRGTPADLTAAAGFYRAAIAAGSPPAQAWRGLGLSLLRAGQAEDGRAALKTYLERQPEAKDRAMIAMLAGEKL